MKDPKLVLFRRLISLPTEEAVREINNLGPSFQSEFESFVRSEESLLQSILSGIASCEAFRKDIQENEDIKVLQLELEDATEDLNDSLRDLERVLKEKKIPPRSFQELEWDGKSLKWEGNLLLHSPRRIRMKSVGMLSGILPKFE